MTTPFYKEQCEPGKLYSWCSCGLSAKMPFCDGTHKTADTDKRSVKFAVEEEKTVVLCGCGRTANPPYCDGSHNSN